MDGGWSKCLYPQTATLQEFKKKNCRESVANPTFIFREGFMTKYFAKSFAQNKL